VLDWLGREQENPALWTVDDLVVLDLELMSPYLTDCACRKLELSGFRVADG
jgi:hypothetical protein